MEIDIGSSISVENISFQYGFKKVINGCSFKLMQGKIYCFLGKNGSGKSTLIKILNGVLRCKNGQVLLDGVNIYKLSKKKKALSIGYVPQSDESFFNFRVIDMVVMGRNPYNKLFQQPQKEDYKIAEEALQTIDIINLRKRFFGELSGGEKQLVLIARALAQNAKFLLLDEPTSHLDFYYQHQVLKAIRYIVKEKNISVLMAMHDPNLTLLFADYIFMLKNGKIQREGTVDEIMNKDSLSALYEMNVKVEKINNSKKMIYASL